ncbi:MAG: hypothetical protein M3220_19055 [Chloroflexota bacterium]|nr:hypothetical protein [Chloroflexota bacterium]
MTEGKRYSVGVMKVQVGEEPRPEFHKTVEAATKEVEARLAGETEQLRFEIFEFSGPHLSPEAGRYSPLDFLQIGLTEKLERAIPFLLVVTDVDLAAQLHTYALALPSQLTNIAVLSTKRLSPGFWGRGEDNHVTSERLQALMLHSLGHLLNLGHSSDPANVMYDFEKVEHLERMRNLTYDQVASLQRHLPLAAREEVAYQKRWAFVWEQIRENWGLIWRAVRRANPLRLVLRLPTMLTAAFSLLIALFFTPDTWDAVGAIGVLPLTFFSLLSILTAAGLLYSAFGLDPGSVRKQGMAEATVVSATATLLTLLLTSFVLYGVFFLLGAGSAAIFLPPEATNWARADADLPVPEEVQLGMFLAAMGVIGGSLGGRADSKKVVRTVLFLDEEA